MCTQFAKEWASLIFKQKIFSSIYRTSQQPVTSVPLILQPNVVFLDIHVSKQAIGIEKGSFMWPLCHTCMDSIFMALKVDTYLLAQAQGECLFF